MKITRKSPFSGKENTMDLPITLQQWHRWAEEGMMIQDAMPHLTPDQREFVMTGITPEEWEATFGKGE